MRLVLKMGSGGDIEARSGAGCGATRAQMLAVVAVLVLGSLIMAGSSVAASAKEPEGVRPAFKLGTPQVTKLDWGTRFAVAADLDGDGRTDLALINNDRARIELLYQRRPGERITSRRLSRSERWEPQLEDALLRKESLATGIRMYDLAVADLDGDGRPDLVYTGDPDGLTVRFQRPKGEFRKRRVLDIEDPVAWSGSLLAEDLNRDGRADLAVLTERRLLVFTQSSAGELEGPRVYSLSNDGCFGLRAMDVDRDGRLDLVLQVANRDDALRIRYGQDDGLGPEQSFPVTSPRGLMQPIHLAKVCDPGLVLIDSATGMLRILGFAGPEEAEEENGLLKQVRPRLFSSRVEGKVPPSYAVADLDGDGDLDIAIADPKGARIWTLLQRSRGIFAEAVEYPALSDVRSLVAADLDGDGRAELVMASPGERTIAVAGLSKRGRLSYPETVASTGKPGGVVAADLDGDGTQELAYFYEERRERGVVVLRRDAAGAWQPTPVELSELKVSPRAITAVDANQDGRIDLALFIPNEPMRLLLQNEAGVLAEANADDGFRKGLLDDVEPSAFTTGDVDGDGLDEMLVAGKGFARALEITDGVLEVVDQYNARSSDTEIASAVVLDLDTDGTPEIILVEAGADKAQVLRRGSDEVYRFAETVQMDGLELVGAGVTDLDGDGRSDLLVYGADRFAWWPLGTRDLTVVERFSFEPELEDVGYQLLAVADLNADGIPEIVAIDSRDSHVLDLLAYDPEAGWSSVMHFTIYESDPHYEGQRGAALEPREALVSDLTADGKTDLVLLVHDRVLVYPQL